MSNGSENTGQTRRIRILHIDDEPDFGDLVKAFLEREYDRFDVVTETCASDGIARLETDSIDCIVSDYDMPEMKGLEFLEQVRGSYPDMPFILFTGKGSEEIASEAIGRGVTDYLQKGTGTEQYEMLGNRILNSVQSYRTEHELEGLGRVLSHDLGNALQIASGRLELALETGETDHLEKVEESLHRAITMLGDLTDAITAGTVVEEVTVAAVGEIFDRAWETQETESATKVVDADIQIKANEMALLRVFENLIRNTLEHGDETATIRVGSLPNGFFVEDDGPGIPEAKRQQVFEPGFSSKEGGTGIGLPSVQQIALAHRWEIEITESRDRGARFEFTNVTMA